MNTTDILINSSICHFISIHPQKTSMANFLDVDESILTKNLLINSLSGDGVS